MTGLSFLDINSYDLPVWVHINTCKYYIARYNMQEQAYRKSKDIIKSGYYTLLPCIIFSNITITAMTCKICMTEPRLYAKKPMAHPISRIIAMM
jgi:hypothetical protein